MKPLNPIPSTLLDTIRNKEAILFIGSDSAINDNLPSDTQLVSMLSSEFNLKEDIVGLSSLFETSEAVNNLIALRSLFAEKLKTDKNSRFYEEFAQIPPINTVLTTRYENNLETSCSAIKRPVKGITSDEDELPPPEGYLLRIIHLCGSIAYPEGLCITKNELQNWADENSDLYEEIRNMVTEMPLVILGFDYTKQRDIHFKALYDSIIQNSEDGTAYRHPSLILYREIYKSDVRRRLGGKKCFSQ